MYNGIIAAVVIVCVYVGLKAVIGHLSPSNEVFSGKGTTCVVLGSILGIFVSAGLFSVSHFWGYVGMAASIGLMYVLFYSGVINALIQHIPASIRRVVRTIFNVLRIILIVAVIGCAVIGVLSYIGV